MLIIISAVLIALYMVTSLGLKERSRKERVWDVVSFSGSLVATFCGVAWAIWLTNREVSSGEREAVISLLAMARADVGQTMETCAEFADADDPAHPFYSDEYVSKAAMPRSGTLEAIIRSEMVLRHLSPATFKVVTTELGLIEAAARLASISGAPAERRRLAVLTGGWYMVVFHALESEIEWQRGHATAKARDSMTRYWMMVETNRDSVAGSWRHFRFNPSVRADLMQEGIERPKK